MRASRAWQYALDNHELRAAGERLAEQLIEKANEVDLLTGVLQLQRRRMRQARQLVVIYFVVAIAAGVDMLVQQTLASAALFFLTLSTAAAGGFLFLQSPPRLLKDLWK